MNHLNCCLEMRHWHQMEGCTEDVHCDDNEMVFTKWKPRMGQGIIRWFEIYMINR